MNKNLIIPTAFTHGQLKEAVPVSGYFVSEKEVTCI